jgi:CrcB protein
MRRVALVFAGGFCGTLARYALSAPLLALAGPLLPAARLGFPYDVLLINLTGAFALGLLYGLVEHGASVAPDVRLTLGTGFLGAYTTFSSLAYGGDRLVAAGQPVAATLYLAGSVALGVLCANAGYAAAARLAVHTPRVRPLRRQPVHPGASHGGWSPSMRTHTPPSPETTAGADGERTVGDPSGVR